VLTRESVRPAGLVIVGDDHGQGMGYHGYYAQSPAAGRRFNPRLRKQIPKAMHQQTSSTGR
jgi:hypothetical protein